MKFIKNEWYWYKYGDDIVVLYVSDVNESRINYSVYIIGHNDEYISGPINRDKAISTFKGTKYYKYMTGLSYPSAYTSVFSALFGE